MIWIDFLLIGFLFGTSFGLVLSVIIDRFLDKQFDNERKQMEFKIEGVAKLINIQKCMHKESRLPGRMIVSQTISRKDGFTSMITNFEENQSILHILFAYVDSLTIGGVPPVTGRP
ncbi:hypothetical protein P9Y72_03775, partial [Bacillus cereus]|nr:hypothetical protein [Bacillus cereus]